jgi:hypothetical protein
MRCIVNSNIFYRFKKEMKLLKISCSHILDRRNAYINDIRARIAELIDPKLGPGIPGQTCR